MTSAKLPLSVAIITRNEEERLPECLASVAFADEVVVVDCGSSDRTGEIAKRAVRQDLERAEGRALAAYQDATGRFVGLANGFLDRLFHPLNLLQVCLSAPSLTVGERLSYRGHLLKIGSHLLLLKKSFGEILIGSPFLYPVGPGQ